MKHFYILLALIVILLAECSNSNDHQGSGSSIDPAMLEGKWYQNKWTMYHTLHFNDNSIFCENSGDTVFSLNYRVINDSIETKHPHFPPKHKRKIKKLNEHELILEGFHDKDGELVYSRTQKK